MPESLLPPDLDYFEYTSETLAPSVVFTGGVHGNEPCGTQALRRLTAQLESGEIALSGGKLKIIPCCNPGAATAGKRYLESNLNRNLGPKQNPKTYEEKLGNRLCPHLDNADILVDFHSYASGDAPFVFIEKGNAQELSFASVLGADWIVCGFQDAFAAVRGRSDPLSVGTTEYARAAGAQLALTVECGQHQSSDSTEFAYIAALRALNALNMLAHPLPPALDVKTNDKAPTLIEAFDVIFKEEEGHFTRPLKHLDYIEKGETLATYESGKKIVMKESGYILLPLENTPVGDDWFLIGRQVQI